MRAVRGEADHHIARLDVRAADDVGFFHHADRETGEVVLAGRIHAGHLGGLAADQRATGLFATERDALDDLGGGIHIQLAAGEIIEEEQRLRALHQDVVDAHADQVDAHRVMAVQFEREFEFGADAVGAGYQHRFAVFFGDLHQCAEAADAVQHFRAHRALGKRFDVFDEAVAGVDIHAGITVGKAAAVDGRQGE